MHYTEMIKDAYELAKQLWVEKKTIAVGLGMLCFGLLYKSPIVFH